MHCDVRSCSSLALAWPGACLACHCLAKMQYCPEYGLAPALWTFKPVKDNGDFLWELVPLLQVDPP